MSVSVLPSEWFVNNVTIRQATIHDAQSITEIKNACHYLYSYDENFYISDISEYQDILLNHNNTEEQSTLYCIVTNTTTLGFFHVYYHYPSKKTVWIKTLIIHPHGQRKGIGRSIIHNIEEQCAVQGIIASQIKVYLKNYTALRFWLSCGYTSIIDFNSEDIFEQHSNRASFVLEKSLA